MILPVFLLLATVLLTIVETTIFGFGSTTPAGPGSREFNVYWNIPTFMCHKYGLHFEEVSRDYGILQNFGDQFRGDRIAILYDPGMFPALLKNSSGHLERRNGGVPQEGNLTRHLEVFLEHLNSQIPEKSFNGIGVIDFESWRPIFRQNWASLSPYKELSISLVRKKHPFWSNRSVEQEAQRVFEKYGRLFMEETLELAKRYRPYATWSYYAYPYCFNLTPNQKTSKCSPQTITENDRMSWLFAREQALLPSVYLRWNLTADERVGLVEGRVREAMRLAGKLTPRQKVLPYYWYKYQDRRDKYLTSADLLSTLRKISNLGADGLIIWGSSNDTNSREKCLQLREYLRDVLGPIVRGIVQASSTREIHEVDDASGNGTRINVAENEVR